MNLVTYSIVYISLQNGAYGRALSDVKSEDVMKIGHFHATSNMKCKKHNVMLSETMHDAHRTQKHIATTEF